MSPTKQKSIENGRAKAAYGFVEEVLKQSYSDEYKSYVKNLPPLIQNNGLGNAVAFINSKDKDAYNKIYQQLEGWLQKKGLIEKKLMKEIKEMESGKYRQVTRETLSLLNWWRRFADGMIDTE